MNKSALLNRAREIIKSGVIRGGFGIGLKPYADASDQELYNALKDIAEQANDKYSRSETIKAVGQELTDIVTALHPNATHNVVPPPVNENKIKGGKADNLKPKDIADKFDLPVSKINRELQMGIKVELEHTKSRKTAEDIAMDHLFEIPDYYTRLKKMEKLGTSYWDKRTDESMKPLIKNLLQENLKKNSVITLLNDFGFLVSLNFSQITKMGKDEASTKELSLMMQNIRKPIINGQTYFDLIKDINGLITQPKMLSLVVGKIREFLIYIEPRIERFVVDGEYKTKWLEKINNLKTLYKSVIQ